MTRVGKLLMNQSDQREEKPSQCVYFKGINYNRALGSHCHSRLL